MRLFLSKGMDLRNPSLQDVDMGIGWASVVFNFTHGYLVASYLFFLHTSSIPAVHESKYHHPHTNNALLCPPTPPCAMLTSHRPNQHKPPARRPMWQETQTRKELKSPAALLAPGWASGDGEDVRMQWQATCGSGANLICNLEDS